MSVPTILLATIALEPSRWGEKRRTIDVARHVERAAGAGFDGFELWQYHADAATVEALRALRVAVPVFSSYVSCEDTAEAADERRRVTETADAVGAEAIKFNVGNDPGRRGEYLAVIANWLEALPAGMRLLCECHPNTLVETPDAAAAAFEAFPRQRLATVVHPLLDNVPPPEAWFAALDGRIAHAHLQLRPDGGGFVAMEQAPERVRAAFAVMHANGFDGRLSVEFVEGTRTANDTPAYLFDRAVEDLAFIRRHWPGAAGR